MHNKAAFGLAVGIMLVSGYAMIGALAWPLKAKLFPLVISIPLFCLATVEALWVLFGSQPASTAMDFRLANDLPRRTILARTAVAVGWMLGFFAAILLLGFLLAVPLFVFLYLKLQGKEGWRFAVIFAAVVSGLFYGLFDLVLHLPFPAGWVQTWLGLA